LWDEENQRLIGFGELKRRSVPVTKTASEPVAEAGLA
jgi:hypothetical protein